MLGKISLYAGIAYFIIKMLASEIRRSVQVQLIRTKGRIFGYTPESERQRNIVIVGANFAGYHAARLIATTLPAHSPYKVVVVEPNSHFQFTWVLPRFCVAKGHEHKAFIPYGGYVAGAPEGSIRWIQDRVVGVTRDTVQLQGSLEEVPYDFLVIATGSEVKEGLPSRSNATEKSEGIRLLQAMQTKVEAAKTVVVVGGGAAGVEIATDTKSLYPEKRVIMVHSRDALMHRFGKRLQKAAIEGMKQLGCEVILNERVVNEDAAAGTVTLKSGRTIECDCFLNCTGQRPASSIVATLSPNSISDSGHIKVTATLKIDDPALTNVYICGDVADTKTPNPNGRSAMRQASVVADNIVLETKGRKPSHKFKASWADGFIKLTLGIGPSVVHMGDANLEIIFKSNDPEELMARDAWKLMGATPFDDGHLKGCQK